jgi:3-hydroxybutyryl-CoA dehydrogenase
MKIGIIGAGAMGSGIAQVAAQNGCQVNVFDTRKEALELADSKLRKTLDKLTAKGKFTAEQSQEILANISYVNSLDAMSDRDLIIEAIIENLDIKKAVFQQLESLVSADCILASNTSSLSIASIAAACEKSERVIGIHFFNPAPIMKLVEIIPAVQTADSITEKAKEIIDSWAKVTVLAKDTPAFIVNRVARPFYGEAIRILEEGIADVATIDWAMTEIAGFRMGPFTLMDFIGHDVNYPVTESVFKAFYYDDRYKPSFTQKRLVEAGFLGRKTKRGFYNYVEGVEKPVPNKDENLGNKIVERIVTMLINEAADALFLNVATKEDIDLAMTKGVNYPKGLLKWADEIGIDNCVDTLDHLFDEYHETRYRCSPLLRRMSKRGEVFFA